jgi:hypothetical protein
MKKYFWVMLCLLLLIVSGCEDIPEGGALVRGHNGYETAVPRLPSNLLDYTSAVSEVCINHVVYYRGFKIMSPKITFELGQPVYHQC